MGTPYQDAKTTFDCWVSTLYIKQGIEKNLIPKEVFNTKITIKVKGKEVMVFSPPDDYMSEMQLMIDNLEHVTLGTCFVSFWESLHRLIQQNKSVDENLKAIIFMFRCAFAHTPTQPKWEIHKPYRKIFNIPQINFSMDFSTLDNKELIPEHHGGMDNLFKLMNYCLEVLKKASQPPDAKEVSNLD
jgi:hypothetical protein